MFFSPSRFRDVVQPALQIVCRTPARQTYGTRPACRAGATPRTFWAAESRKSGVAPARFDVLSIAPFLFAAFPFLCRTRTSLRYKVKKVTRKKVQSVISILFTLSQRIRRLLRQPGGGPAQQNTRHNCGRCLAIQGTCTYANRTASYLQMLELL